MMYSKSEWIKKVSDTIVYYRGEEQLLGVLKIHYMVMMKMN